MNKIFFLASFCALLVVITANTMTMKIGKSISPTLWRKAQMRRWAPFSFTNKNTLNFTSMHD